MATGDQKYEISPTIGVELKLDALTDELKAIRLLLQLLAKVKSEKT